MERLRTPFLVVAVILWLLVILIEVSSLAFLQDAGSGGAEVANLKKPGLGISYLALMDGIVFYTVLMFGLALVISARVMGIVQGIATFIFSLLLTIGSIVCLIAAIVYLTMLITLLLAIPFGTIAYMAGFSSFKVGAASATLGVLMLFKIVAAVCMVLAQQRFLKVKALVFMILCSLLVNVIVSFLHSFPPGFIVTITDALAAIIISIVALIWAITKLIGSIPAIIKLIRVDKAFT